MRHRLFGFDVFLCIFVTHPVDLWPTTGQSNGGGEGEGGLQADGGGGRNATPVSINLRTNQTELLHEGLSLFHSKLARHSQPANPHHNHQSLRAIYRLADGQPTHTVVVEDIQDAHSLAKERFYRRLHPIDVSAGLAVCHATVAPLVAGGGDW